MYRNQSQRAVKKGKSDLFKNQIEENQGNGKKLWDTLKQLGLPNKKQISQSNMHVLIITEISPRTFGVILILVFTAFTSDGIQQYIFY